MRWPEFLSRRGFLRAMLGASSLRGLAAVAQSDVPKDRGIGGTGAAASDEKELDRGIGGTGVIGTIRRFGSIEVNGLRITFPRTVRVSIDGRGAQFEDLKIGHVVQVVAHHTQGRLATRRIDAWSEVVGPVESRTENGLEILGQSVLIDRELDVQPGDFVAVSGLRRLDGVIVASLVEPRTGSQVQVAGVPHLDQDGSIRIGALQLLGLPSALVDRRTLVSGDSSGGVFRVDHATPEPFGAAISRPARFSIEAYVAFRDGELQTGSGFPVEGGESASIPAQDGEMRAILSATLGPDDRFLIHAVRPERGGRAPGTGHALGAPAPPGSPTGVPGPQSPFGGGPPGSPGAPSPGAGGFGGAGPPATGPGSMAPSGAFGGGGPGGPGGPSGPGGPGGPGSPGGPSGR